jgi:hypothetical protein
LALFRIAVEDYICGSMCMKSEEYLEAYRRRAFG